MTTSINHPWGISEKYKNRYGEIWTNLDFVFESKISAENFKTEPMNCLIGHLHIFNQKIAMRYKDLISYEKSVNTCTENVYSIKPTKEEVFPVDIKGQTMMLRKHELGKLSQTLSDALTIAMRSYELGLYL